MKKFVWIALIVLLFSLRGSSQEIRFGVITDIHHGFLTDVNNRLQKFIDTCNALDVDFIIQIGDFSLAMNEAEAGSFLAIWNSFDGPRYHVLGNHDMDRNTKQKVMKFLGMEKNYYSFDMKGYHFVVMDGNYIKKDDGSFIDYDHGNYFHMNRDWHGDRQLLWFSQDLANTSLPTVRFSHLHRQAKDRKEVETVISNANRAAGYKKVLLSLNGHGHQDVEEIIDGVPYVEIPTASHKWNGEEGRAEPYTTVRFAIVTINAQKGTLFIKGYSLPVEYQQGLPAHEGTITDKHYTFQPYDLKASFVPETDCTDTVVFRNTSLGGTFFSSWDFGDGHSSAEGSPVHVYDVRGTYEVQLTVDNGTESHSFKKKVPVRFAEVPSVTNGSRTGEGPVELSASVTDGGKIYWYEKMTGDAPLDTGTVYTTPPISQTIFFYAENHTGGPQHITGAKKEKGQGDFIPENGRFGLQFDALTDFILRSVKVYNGESTAGGYTGPRTITLVSSYGTILATDTVEVPAGESRITLDMHVPAGKGLLLLAGPALGLGRDTAAVAYPYSLGEEVFITAGIRPEGKEDEDQYDVFYDWEIEADVPVCRSKRVPVEAAVVVGITDEKGTDGISVYPVPSRGFVNIDLDKRIEKLSVRVYNAEGQCVKKERFRDTAYISLDLHDLPQGSYFLRLMADRVLLATKKFSLIK